MKSISVIVKGIDNRKYTARIRNEPIHTAISLKNTFSEEKREIQLVDGPFLIILIQDSFNPQIIDIGSNKENHVFSLIIEKIHSSTQPTIKLIHGNKTIKCALYHQCAGGGLSFILAVGDSNDSISLTTIKKYFPYGALQPI